MIRNRFATDLNKELIKFVICSNRLRGAEFAYERFNERFGVAGRMLYERNGEGIFGKEVLDGKDVYIS